EESPDLGLGAVRAGEEFKVTITIPPLWLNPGLYAAEFKALLWGTRDNARQVSDKIPIDMTGTYSPGEALLHPRARWRAVGRWAAPGSPRHVRDSGRRGKGLLARGPRADGPAPGASRPGRSGNPCLALRVGRPRPRSPEHHRPLSGGPP